MTLTTAFPVFYVLAAILLIIHQGAVHASCDRDPASQGMSLQHSQFPETQVDSASQYQFDTSEWILYWQGRHWNFTYDYRAMDFPAQPVDAPVTNGYLHSLTAGYSDSRELAGNLSMEWQLAPVIAVSSNQLKHTDELQSGSLRVDGYLSAHYTMIAGIKTFGGICLSAITGEYALIPVLGIRQEAANWSATIAYPHSSAEYRLSASLAVHFDWSESGNEWEVLDENLRNRSEFNMQARQLKTGLQLAISETSRAEIYWLHRYNQEISYLARNGKQLSVDAEDSNGWLLRFFLVL